MKSDIDEVALQGIEFWSNVCDEEIDLDIEASEVSLGGLICWKLCYSDWVLELNVFVDVIFIIWESFILTGVRRYLHL